MSTERELARSDTQDDGVLRQLRREGILGPFRVGDWCAATDIGRVRGENEDRWRAVDDTLFVVADGMGGRPGGGLAAEVAVDVAATFGRGMTEASGPELAARANRAVLQVAEAQGLDRAGTTLVVLAAHRTHVVVLGVGDSRAYRHRAGELDQLTRDHTVRAEFLEAGIALEQAERANIRLDALTSHIGRRSEFGITSHTCSYSIAAGDRFLVCTDGIHGQLTPADIGRSLAGPTCADAAHDLLARARAAGGADNATAIVVEFSMADGRSGGGIDGGA